MKNALWGGVVCVPVIGVAAPTAELRVKGELQSPQCAIHVPQQGEYELTTTDRAGREAGTLSPSITQTWRVVCDTPMLMHMTPIDNRMAGSGAASAEHFGLWGGDGVGAVGFYYLEFTDARVDGVPARLQMSGNAMRRAQTGKSLTWMHNNGGAALGKVFSVDITVLPNISGLNVMRWERTEKITFDGSTTLNFNYGI
jgi:hypothetical protein